MSSSSGAKGTFLHYSPACMIIAAIFGAAAALLARD
jgi:hypothetical protein